MPPERSHQMEPGRPCESRRSFAYLLLYSFKRREIKPGPKLFLSRFGIDQVQGGGISRMGKQPGRAVGVIVMVVAVIVLMMVVLMVIMIVVIMIVSMIMGMILRVAVNFGVVVVGIAGRGVFSLSDRQLHLDHRLDVAAGIVAVRNDQPDGTPF